MKHAVHHWWLSSRRMTVYVGTDINNVIVETAPITRKFIGQPIKNLANWLRKQGGFQYHKLSG